MRAGCAGLQWFGHSWEGVRLGACQGQKAGLGSSVLSGGPACLLPAHPSSGKDSRPVLGPTPPPQTEPGPLSPAEGLQTLSLITGQDQGSPRPGESSTASQRLRGSQPRLTPSPRMTWRSSTTSLHHLLLGRTFQARGAPRDGGCVIPAEMGWRGREDLRTWAGQWGSGSGVPDRVDDEACAVKPGSPAGPGSRGPASWPHPAW